MYIFLLLKQTLWPLKTHANTDSDMAKGQCLCYLQAGIFARHGTLVPQKMRVDGDADAAGSRGSSIDCSRRVLHARMSQLSSQRQPCL